MMLSKNKLDRQFLDSLASGLYYEHIFIVIDNSKILQYVMLQIVASLTIINDDPS